MTGVPTSFHLGPLVFHTYGFGLAIAAYVCYLYARRRLTKADFNVLPFGKFAFCLIVAGLLGARLANIATNWGYYSDHPARWIAVWQGGLASFGGIALALPVGLYLQRRWWPGSSLARFSDALVPALIAGWALGRVLGPQFMVNGGGHLTHQWFGIHYHGQVGKRVPVVAAVWPPPRRCPAVAPHGEITADRQHGHGDGRLVGPDQAAAHAALGEHGLKFADRLGRTEDMTADAGQGASGRHPNREPDSLARHLPAAEPATAQMSPPLAC